MTRALCRLFFHRRLPFLIVALRHVATGDVRVRTYDFTGNSAVVVFPDGFSASLVHEVDPLTEPDVLEQFGIEAINILVDVAEADIRRLT